MSSVSPQEALKFVKSAKLPKPSKSQAIKVAPTAVAEFDFDKARDQAVVVGSDIVSFVSGVTEQRREDVVNSALLAQLVADEEVKDKSHIFAWYEAYFNALTKMGWAVQAKDFVEHTEGGQSFQVNKAIMTVAAALLGPNVAALQLVKMTLDALQSMDKDSPWITLFDRQSRSAKNAKFQITLAEQAPDGQFLVTLMAFGLSATKTLTQVLFFKFGKADVLMKHASGKVTISTQVMDHIRQAIIDQINAFADDLIKGFNPKPKPK